MYKKIVEQKRTFKFLLGLNKELDEVRGRIMGIKPLPTIREAFLVVRREESRRKAMMIGDSSMTLTTEGFAFFTHSSSQSNQEFKKRGRSWCEHCKKPCHIKETCWKIHGKPVDWKPDRALMIERGMQTLLLYQTLFALQRPVPLPRSNLRHCERYSIRSPFLLKLLRPPQIILLVW